MAKDWISFLDILTKTVRQLKPRAEEKEISLTVEKHGTRFLILANSSALKHLLINLIVNAIKYNKKGGKINIKVEEQSNYIKTEISDTGIGISENALLSIFEDFYRAENAEDMEKNGTGLGLSNIGFRCSIYYESRLSAPPERLADRQCLRRKNRTTEPRKLPSEARLTCL